MIKEGNYENFCNNELLLERSVQVYSLHFHLSHLRRVLWVLLVGLGVVAIVDIEWLKLFLEVWEINLLGLLIEILTSRWCLQWWIPIEAMSIQDGLLLRPLMKGLIVSVHWVAVGCLSQWHLWRKECLEVSFLVSRSELLLHLPLVLLE